MNFSRPISCATRLKRSQFTSAARRTVSWPSGASGNFVNSASVTASSSTASPRYSRRSLWRDFHEGCSFRYERCVSASFKRSALRNVVSIFRSSSSVDLAMVVILTGGGLRLGAFSLAIDRPQDPVHELSRVRAAETFRHLDGFVDRDFGRNFVRICVEKLGEPDTQDVTVYDRDFIKRPLGRGFHDDRVDLREMLNHALKDLPCEFRLVNAGRELLKIALQDLREIGFAIIKIPFVKRLEDDCSYKVPSSHSSEFSRRSSDQLRSRLRDPIT